VSLEEKRDGNPYTPNSALFTGPRKGEWAQTVGNAKMHGELQLLIGEEYRDRRERRALPPDIESFREDRTDWGTRGEIGPQARFFKR